MKAKSFPVGKQSKKEQEFRSYDPLVSFDVLVKLHEYGFAPIQKKIIEKESGMKFKKFMEWIRYTRIHEGD